jgi:hypothetical protein
MQAVELLAAPVGGFVTPASKLLTVDPTCTVVSALRKMSARGIRHLPVIEAGADASAGLRIESVVGVLAIADLWVQRDSEALQDKYQDQLGVLNPRFLRARARDTHIQWPILIGSAGLFATTVALFTEQAWMAGHWQLAMIVTFVLGCVRGGVRARVCARRKRGARKGGKGLAAQDSRCSTRASALSGCTRCLPCASLSRAAPSRSGGLPFSVSLASRSLSLSRSSLSPARALGRSLALARARSERCRSRWLRR